MTMGAPARAVRLQQQAGTKPDSEVQLGVLGHLTLLGDVGMVADLMLTLMAMV